MGVGDIGSGSGVELGRERESLPVAKAASSSRAVWDLGGGSTRGMLAAGAEMVIKTVAVNTTLACSFLVLMYHFRPRRAAAFLHLSRHQDCTRRG
jgi:hypothetical protein